MIFKKLLARRKDQTEIINHEVSRALKRQELKNIDDMADMRMSYVRGQNSLQDDMQKETEKVKIDSKKNYDYQLNQLRLSYENRIKELNKIISEAKGKIKYAQEFWRKLYSDSDALHNISIVLKSKAMILLENERDEVAAMITKRTEDYKGISAECEKLDGINRTLNKNTSEAEKLMFLQIEEKE